MFAVAAGYLVFAWLDRSRTLAALAAFIAAVPVLVLLSDVDQPGAIAAAVIGVGRPRHRPRVPPTRHDATPPSTPPSGSTTWSTNGSAWGSWPSWPRPTGPTSPTSARPSASPTATCPAT